MVVIIILLVLAILMAGINEILSIVGGENHSWKFYLFITPEYGNLEMSIRFLKSV